MPEGRDTKRIYNWKPKKRRPPGRPRKRWEDQIREITQREQRDFEEVKNLTQDRVAWRNLTQRLTTDRPEGLQASGSAVATITSSMAGGIVGLLLSYTTTRMFEIPYLLNGVLGSLVSVTDHFQNKGN
ncbi:Ammonium Transporter Family [Branchiostoma belcheri]|nr:Ammonium Transporter Family [Branchiostoma belcheri]